MASRGRPKLSPDAKIRAFEQRKEKQKAYEKSLKILRISSDVYERWGGVKSKEKLKTNDDVAKYLLDLWDMFASLSKTKTITRLQTPMKVPVVQSTPLSAVPVAPLFPISDISDSNAGSGTDRLKEESIVSKCSKRAKQTDGSFVDISFEILQEEKELSYQPSSSDDDSEDDSEYFDDFDEDEIEEFNLEMSLPLEPEYTAVPITAAADMIFQLDDDLEDDSEFEEEDVTEANEERNYVNEVKAICFEKNLLNLAKIHVPVVCNRKACNAMVTTISKQIGTSLRISWVCANGHKMKTWNSQPVMRRMRVGDILLSAAILTSGNNFDKINLLFKFFGLGITRKATHYKLQSTYFCPVIGDEFESMILQNLQKYENREVVIAGDCRMDSPGHSAQYCTYTLMEYESKDILACMILDKRMTGLKSTLMEVEGLRRGLKFIEDSGVKVVELVTDASTTVAAMMRKDYPAIRHSFDTWQGAKNFGKKIGAVAAENRNKDLRPWVSHLINHFWYCSRTACGEKDIILRKWRGILHHVINVHQWLLGDGTVVPECDHEQLDPDDTENKWLEPGGAAHLALTKVMLDPRTLYKLHHYTNFRHTGVLENLHDHILMYCAKRFAYIYPAYKTRNYLAILDYSHHKDRPVLLNKNGETRLHRCYSKRNGAYSVYSEKEPKKYEYMTAMLEQLLNTVFLRTETINAPVKLTPTDPRKIKRRMSAETPPPSKTLLESKKSRLGDTKSSQSLFMDSPPDKSTSQS